MISNVLNYYVSTYRNQVVSKYDTHKKNELRDVYNSMLKVNKRSPLYKIASTESVQTYAIDLKEAARSIKNVVSSLTDDEGNISGSSKKKATSSNKKVAEAKYIGEASEHPDEIPDSISLFVESLAGPQINTGNHLTKDSLGLTKGPYSFDLSIGEYTYEFQFNVKSEDTNLKIEERLARLINRSKVGIHAGIHEDEEGKVALQLTSDSTGVPAKSDLIFKISDSDGVENGDAVSYLGLSNVSSKPENARFKLDGMERQSSSNIISVDKKFEITLKGKSIEGDETIIGLKPDFDALTENLSEFIDAYNGIVDLAQRKQTGTYESGHLYRDISGIANYHKNALESSGFTILPDGHMQLDRSLLAQSVDEGTLSESLDTLTKFKNSLVRKSDNISLNPLQYVDKKLISYPHPTKNLTSPYSSSKYSGLLFNGYI